MLGNHELSESVLVLTNFPENRKKVYEIAQNFLRENGLGKSYRIENTTDTIKFFMKNSKLCMELLKKFQEIKKVQKEYMNLDVKMEIIEPTEQEKIKQHKFLEFKSKQRKQSLKKRASDLDDEYRKMSYFQKHNRELIEKAKGNCVFKDGPYVTKEELDRIAEKESRKLDFDKKRLFKSCVHKKTANPKLDTLPVGNIGEHKFRDIKKEKWVSKYDFDKY